MRRVISYILVFVILISVLSIPSFAVSYGEGREIINPIYDTSSVSSWNSYFTSYMTIDRNIIAAFFETFGFDPKASISSGISAFVFEAFNLWFSACHNYR